MSLAAGFMASKSALGQRTPVVPYTPGLIDFTPVTRAEATGSWPTISSDYEWQVLIPWGDPVVPDGPCVFAPTERPRTKQGKSASAMMDCGSSQTMTIQKLEIEKGCFALTMNLVGMVTY